MREEEGFLRTHVNEALNCDSRLTVRLMACRAMRRIRFTIAPLSYCEFSL